MPAPLQGPDMTNPCCKVWLDGAKAIPVDDRPDRPPGCNLVSFMSGLLLTVYAAGTAMLPPTPCPLLLLSHNPIILHFGK